MRLDELSEVYRLKTRREKLHGRMEEMRASAAAHRRMRTGVNGHRSRTLPCCLIYIPRALQRRCGTSGKAHTPLKDNQA